MPLKMPYRELMSNDITRLQCGFTLIEAVIVIAITGIVAAVVAVFIRAPVEGYFASARRAELTDTADIAVRRISRDLRLALPNSVRVSGNTVIEFLHTRTGGRYRAEPGIAATELDFLDFTQNDTTFELLGPAITFAAGDQIVIYNLGIDGADAYAGNSLATHNRRALNVAGAGANTTVQLDGAITELPFPFESPNRSFQVVDTPVSYICDGGILRRYWGYAIQPLQTADTVAELNALIAAHVPPGGNAMLANNVVNCIFTYVPGVTARNGLVTIRLSVGSGGETVTLYHEVHVSNVP
jgi:MSHA biogenesis protein MshO